MYTNSPRREIEHNTTRRTASFASPCVTCDGLFCVCVAGCEVLAITLGTGGDLGASETVSEASCV